MDLLGTEQGSFHMHKMRSFAELWLLPRNARSCRKGWRCDQLSKVADLRPCSSAGSAAQTCFYSRLEGKAPISAPIRKEAQAHCARNQQCPEETSGCCYAPSWCALPGVTSQVCIQSCFLAPSVTTSLMLLCVPPQILLAQPHVSTMWVSIGRRCADSKNSEFCSPSPSPVAPRSLGPHCPGGTLSPLSVVGGSWCGKGKMQDSELVHLSYCHLTLEQFSMVPSVYVRLYYRPLDSLEMVMLGIEPKTFSMPSMHSVTKPWALLRRLSVCVCVRLIFLTCHVREMKKGRAAGKLPCLFPLTGPSLTIPTEGKVSFLWEENANTFFFTGKILTMKVQDV